MSVWELTPHSVQFDWPKYWMTRPSPTALLRAPPELAKLDSSKVEQPLRLCLVRELYLATVLHPQRQATAQLPGMGL
jgi:hypothetical protein